MTEAHGVWTMGEDARKGELVHKDEDGLLHVLRTKTGLRITQEMIDRWVAEAEGVEVAMDDGPP